MPRSCPWRTEQTNAAARAASLTRVQAFTRERKLLSLYTHHLYSLATDTDALIAACFGPDLSGKRLDAALERLDEDVPELIRHLRYDEQEALEILLSESAPDLVQVVHLILRQERKLIQREPLSILLNDEAQYRSAGLGRITSENYGKLRPGYLPDLLPAPKQLVIVRLPKPKPRFASQASRWVQTSLFA